MTYPTYEQALAAALRRNNERQRPTHITVGYDQERRVFDIRNGLPGMGAALRGPRVVVALTTPQHWVFEYVTEV